MMNYHRKYLLFESDYMCRSWGKKRKFIFYPQFFRSVLRTVEKLGKKLTLHEAGNEAYSQIHSSYVSTTTLLYIDYAFYLYAG